MVLFALSTEPRPTIYRLDGRQDLDTNLEQPENLDSLRFQTRQLLFL